DGFVDEQRYYCSETPIELNALPVPKAVLAGDVRTYVDANVTKGTTYYIRVGSVKNGIEKISDEISIVAKAHYVNLFFSTSHVFVFGDSAQLLADQTVGGLTIGSLSANKSNVFQLTDSPNIQDFTAEFDATMIVGSGGEASLGLLFRTTNWSSNSFGTAGILVSFSQTRVIIGYGTNSTSGNEIEVTGIGYSFGYNKRKIKIQMVGTTLNVYVDSILIGTRTINSISSSGSFGFRSWSSSSGVSMKIQNLQITEHA
ncbi:hypothetical protein KTH33_16915, partial [Acinetobacter johnsonii]|nr:hypothetical protein [Acinetobacter johnsonii]